MLYMQHLKLMNTDNESKTITAREEQGYRF